MNQGPPRRSIRTYLLKLHGYLKAERAVVRPVAAAGVFGLVGAFLLYLVLSAGAGTATKVQAEGGDQETCHHLMTSGKDKCPTKEPTEEPTDVPTEEPTEVPTEEPTEVPTEEPTEVPTEEPTGVPTEEPTGVPTEEPTGVPTEEPTIEITIEAVAPAVEEPTALPPAAPVEVEPTAAVSEVAPAVAAAQPVQALPATGSGGPGDSGDAPVWLFPVLLAGLGGLAWYVKRANRA